MRWIFFGVAVVVVFMMATMIFVGRFMFTTKPVFSMLVTLDVGGELLPFELEYFQADDGNGWVVHSRNLERDRVGSVRVPPRDITATRFRVAYPHFDSVLDLRDDDRDGIWEGTWTKVRGSGGQAILTATGRGPSGQVSDHFGPRVSETRDADFSGRWRVTFETSPGETAVGVFGPSVLDDQLVTGTFLTPTGDYRYLAGRVDGELMRLSTFDGAHAFLFHARMQPDGTIAGDFWSGNWHHDTWTAVRDARAALPDAFGQTSATGGGVEELAFRDLDGSPRRVADLLDAGDAPARVLYLFGSWCPNCADAGVEMRRLKEKYAEQLTVVGLAFEQTEDFERSARQVRLYAERHGADWPVLIAGLSDKAKASAELPVLDRVRAFPTTIFLNARNEIVAVHTGFNGPATGEDHRRQQWAFEEVIDGVIGGP